MLHKTFGIIKENSSRLPADKDSDFWINYPCTCQRAFHLTLAIISIANDNFHKQKLVPRKTNVNQKVASRTLYWLQCLLCAVKFPCILFRILFSFVSYFKTAFSVEIEISNIIAPGLKWKCLVMVFSFKCDQKVISFSDSSILF